MKTLLLSAGRGQRMRPFTDHTPKPLLEMGGKPLIVHHLLRLAEIGFKEIVINVSYLAEKIIFALGNGEQYGVNIQYSFEKETLETGGGIVKALPLLGPDPFLVVSADILTDYPFQTLPKKLTHLAHLVMVKNPVFHPQGDFVLENNFLKQEGSEKLTFGNMGIYHPKLFENRKIEKFPLVDVLKQGMAQQAITGEFFDGRWENIGSSAL